MNEHYWLRTMNEHYCANCDFFARNSDGIFCTRPSGFCNQSWKSAKQTNADRIRDMSDEEIEEWYWWMHKEMMRYTDSRVFLHDWLKQEAEE